MKKIISNAKKERQDRNKAMIAYFENAMREGSDKTAVYKYLAKKHKLTYQRVCVIINEYKKCQSNNTRK
jgi:hypothetical protein